MSLKVFHISFVTISVLLLVGFAGWCFIQSGSGSVLIGVISIAAEVLLAFYGHRFLKKIKRIEFQ